LHSQLIKMNKDKDILNFLKWTLAGFIAFVLLGISLKPEPTHNLEKKSYKVPNISALIKPIDQDSDQSKENIEAISKYDFVMH